MTGKHGVRLLQPVAGDRWLVGSAASDSKAELLYGLRNLRRNWPRDEKLGRLRERP